MRLFFCTVILTLFLSSAQASDHIDGAVTMKHRVADLTDLYAFPSPGRTGFLTIIINTYPIVPKAGHFDSKVSYQLTLRKASIVDQGLRMGINTDAASELTIRCTFITPHAHQNHQATCRTSTGLRVQAPFNRVISSPATAEIQLFAGMRLDPFFFNRDWADAASTQGKLLPPEDSNVMAQINVLSLVMELDLNRILPNHSLFAISAEAFAQDNPAAPERRMDRLGRPEITNVSLVANQAAADLRDLYNLDPPFQVADANRQRYRQRLVSNIDYYDALDGKTDWNARDRDLLADLFMDDYLVIDLSKPCAGDQFLAIERAILQRKPHTSCGGRKLTDDIMDTLFTLYIAGTEGSRIRDGVDQPSVRPLSTFPYLEAPDLSFAAVIKANLARAALGL